MSNFQNGYSSLKMRESGGFRMSIAAKTCKKMLHKPRINNVSTNGCMLAMLQQVFLMATAGTAKLLSHLHNTVSTVCRRAYNEQSEKTHQSPVVLVVHFLSERRARQFTFGHRTHTSQSRAAAHIPLITSSGHKFCL